MSRWPGLPDWDSQSYWMGVATTFAFMQAELDTEENAKAGGSPVLRARLPYMERPEPEDPQRFGAAIAELNEECKILYWRVAAIVEGEYRIELCSTEGYQGLPPWWEQAWWEQERKISGR